MLDRLGGDVHLVLAALVDHVRRELVGKSNDVADASTLARLRPRLPRSLIELAREQKLETAISRVQARRNHARVVDDERIARFEPIRKRRERIVLDPIRRRDDHHPRLPALTRLLRDEVGREVVGEVGALHDRRQA